MYALAAIAGLVVGVIVWVLASHWIASSIAWVEDHRPELVGSIRLRVGEVIACGALFLGCLGLAFWLIRWLLTQIRLQ
jgi:hypothetical protein